MEEIKSVFTEKHAFEYQDKSKLLWKRGRFGQHWCSREGHIYDFSNLSLFTCLEFSAETLMEELKSAIAENYEFEYLDKAILVA